MSIQEENTPIGFAELSHIASSDPLRFSMALTAILTKGTERIREWTPADIELFLDSWKNFLTREYAKGVYDLALKLSRLDINDLINYLYNAGYPHSVLDADGNKLEDEEGICPVCGAAVEFEDNIQMDGGGVYPWKCPTCGATGKQGYNEVFDGHHYDVRDGDGKSLPGHEELD